MLNHFIAYLPCRRFTSSQPIVVQPLVIYRRTTSLASSTRWSSKMLTIGLTRDSQLGFCIKSSSFESCLGMYQLFVGAGIALGKGMNRADDHTSLLRLVYLLGPLSVVTSWTGGERSYWQSFKVPVKSWMICAHFRPRASLKSRPSRTGSDSLHFFTSLIEEGSFLPVSVRPSMLLSEYL